MSSEERWRHVRSSSRSRNVLLATSNARNVRGPSAILSIHMPRHREQAYQNYPATAPDSARRCFCFTVACLVNCFWVTNIRSLPGVLIARALPHPNTSSDRILTLILCNPAFPSLGWLFPCAYFVLSAVSFSTSSIKPPARIQCVQPPCAHQTLSLDCTIPCNKNKQIPYPARVF